MRKLLNKKLIFAIIGLVILSFIINKLVIDMIQRPVRMVETESLWQDMEIQKSELMSNSITTWDNSNLKIYNLEGELIEEVIGNGYFTNIYYWEDEIGVLDKQLNVLYIYSSTGDLKNKIQLSGSVYSVFNKDGDIYIHRKDQLNSQRIETLTKLEGDRREEPIYETNRFIINFLIEGSTTYISEITTENYAYKSVLSILEDGETKVFDFGNETVLDMMKVSNRLMVVTNKNLYSISGNEREKIELNNFKDYEFEKNKVVVLFGNNLVKYNSDLSVDSSFEVGISSSGILKHDGGYFVYGPTDLVGYVGENRQFNKSFDSIVNSVSSNGNSILVTHKYNVELYTFEKIEEEN